LVKVPLKQYLVYLLSNKADKQLNCFIIYQKAKQK
jgi:hypothetical protein